MTRLPDLNRARRTSLRSARLLQPAAVLDFTGWDPLAIGVDGDLRDVSRDDAERAYATLMGALPARIASLAALTSRHGVELDGADAAVGLGAWLCTVAAAAGPDAIGTPAWSSLAADVALWLGQRVIVATAGAVRWQHYVAHKKATGYQRAVLVGFAAVDDPRYYVDVAHFVASWLELALRRRGARPDFLAVIAASALRDAGVAP